MTDNNDGDLFGTHAAWPTSSDEVSQESNSPAAETVVSPVDESAIFGGEAMIFTTSNAVPIPSFVKTTEPDCGFGVDAAPVVSIPNSRGPDEQLTGEFPNAEEAQETGVVVEETEDAKRRRIIDEVQTWTDAKEASTAAVATEREARGKLTATMFPNPKKGTQRADLDAGYKLKLVFGWNYKLGDADKVNEQGLKVPVYDQVAALEAAITALGGEGPLLAPRLIKWTPTLVEAEYLRLCRDDASETEVAVKELIDELLTVTEKSPTLELEEPKPPKG